MKVPYVQVLSVVRSAGCDPLDLEDPQVDLDASAASGTRSQEVRQTKVFAVTQVQVQDY